MKTYRQFIDSPLRRVQEAFRLSPGRRPSAPGSTTFVSDSGPNDSAMQVTQISGGVNIKWQDATFGESKGFSAFLPALHAQAFSVSGYNFMAAPPSNENPYSTFALTLDGQKLEIFGRAGNKYTLIDLRTGQFLDSGIKTVASSAGYATMRTLYDFGSWSTRDILLLAQNYGLAGFAIEPLASISKYDLTRLLSCCIMGDSYTQQTCTHHTLGPTGEMLMHLVRPGFGPLIYSSSGGGSGFLSPGNSNRTFVDATRLSRYVAAAAGADLCCGLGGINDGPTSSVAAATTFFQAIRAASPNAVILWAASQTPRDAYFANSQLQVGFIQTALAGISGPWAFVDMTRGAWSNSSGKSGRYGRAPWVWGTGNAGTPTGVGNSDLYTNADNVHTANPGAVAGVQGGSEYLGACFFGVAREAILAI